jgi:DNA-directed RNA polymerase sigma subunit (sigma70/sigma32)
VIPLLRQKLDEFDDRVVLLRGATSAEQRAMLAAELWEFVRSELQPAVTTERRAAVRALRADYTLSAIGEMLGVTDSRVAQIVKGPE